MLYTYQNFLLQFEYRGLFQKKKTHTDKFKGLFFLGQLKGLSLKKNVLFDPAVVSTKLVRRDKKVS